MSLIELVQVFSLHFFACVLQTLIVCLDKVLYDYF